MVEIIGRSTTPKKHGWHNQSASYCLQMELHPVGMDVRCFQNPNDRAQALAMMAQYADRTQVAAIEILDLDPKKDR